MLPLPGTQIPSKLADFYAQLLMQTYDVYVLLNRCELFKLEDDYSDILYFLNHVNKDFNVLALGNSGLKILKLLQKEPKVADRILRVVINSCCFDTTILEGIDGFGANDKMGLQIMEEMKTLNLRSIPQILSSHASVIRPLSKYSDPNRLRLSSQELFDLFKEDKSVNSFRLFRSSLYQIQKYDDFYEDLLKIETKIRQPVLILRCKSDQFLSWGDDIQGVKNIENFNYLNLRGKAHVRFEWFGFDVFYEVTKLFFDVY